MREESRGCLLQVGLTEILNALRTEVRAHPAEAASGATYVKGKQSQAKEKWAALVMARICQSRSKAAKSQGGGKNQRWRELQHRGAELGVRLGELNQLAKVMSRELEAETGAARAAARSGDAKGAQCDVSPVARVGLRPPAPPRKDPPPAAVGLDALRGDVALPASASDTMPLSTDAAVSLGLVPGIDKNVTLRCEGAAEDTLAALRNSLGLKPSTPLSFQLVMSHFAITCKQLLVR